MSDLIDMYRDAAAAKASRPDWDQVWMDVAHTIAKRSRCDGRQIGAVIASADNAYVVVGYNGPPASFDVDAGSTCSSWCPRRQTGNQTRDYANCVSVHAETNAIAKADRTRIDGGTLYVTSAICWDCSKVVANSGVKRVLMEVDWVADKHRSPMYAINFLARCDIAVQWIDMRGSADG